MIGRQMYGSISGANCEHFRLLMADPCWFSIEHRQVFEREILLS